MFRCILHRCESDMSVAGLIHCNTLQDTAVHCNKLHHTVNRLRCVRYLCRDSFIATHCNTQIPVAVLRKMQVSSLHLRAKWVDGYGGNIGGGERSRLSAWSKSSKFGVDGRGAPLAVVCVASVLQCVAVCCSLLQRVAACCSVLQRVAVYCSSESMPGMHSSLGCVLQCVAVCCSVLQCVAVCCRMSQPVAACGNLLWFGIDSRGALLTQVCVAACCSVLQCIVV